MHLKCLYQTVNKVMCHWIIIFHCNLYIPVSCLEEIKLFQIVKIALVVFNLIDIHYMVQCMEPKKCIILYYRQN